MKNTNMYTVRTVTMITNTVKKVEIKKVIEVRRNSKKLWVRWV
jgi:hypothetical protein